jgi:hypothetical protein
MSTTTPPPVPPTAEPPPRHDEIGRHPSPESAATLDPPERKRSRKSRTLSDGPDGGKTNLLTYFVSIIKQLCLLWSDHRRTAFATVQRDGYDEHLEIGSKGFDDFVAKEVYAATQEYPTSRIAKEVVSHLAAEALYCGVSHPTWVRVAEHGGTLYLDLGDSERNVIEITPEGWRVDRRCPVRFRRPISQRPLPLPVRGGSIDELRSFLNVATEDDFRLISAVAVSWFRPTGPDFMLCINGEQGSAKTTATNVLQRLIDPQEATARTLPRTEEDLAVAAQNSILLSYDNLALVSKRMSDTLCRTSTGFTHSRRMLYHGKQEQVLNVQCAIILNGINQAVDESDAVSRSVILTLPPIAGSARRTERELWDAFDEAHGRILGAMLDAMAGALRLLRDGAAVPSGAQLPRMADAALFAAAVTKSFGWGDSFLPNLQRNQDDAVLQAMEYHPVAKAIVDLMAETDEWDGTATDLLGELSALTSYQTRRVPEWPAGPQQLSNTLDRITPALSRGGIGVSRTRTSDSARQRIIKIRRCTDGERAADASLVHEVHRGGSSPLVNGPRPNLEKAPAPDGRRLRFRGFADLFRSVRKAS